MGYKYNKREVLLSPIYFLYYDGEKIDFKIYTHHSFYYDKSKPFFALSNLNGDNIKIRRRTFVLNMMGGNQYKYYAYLDYKPENKDFVRVLKMIYKIKKTKLNNSIEELRKDREYNENVLKTLNIYLKKVGENNETEY